MFKFAGIKGDRAIHNTDEVVRFVEDRVKNNVDFIKIIADVPGHDQDVLDRIQVEAAKHNKLTIAHVADNEAFPRSLHVKFNILTHTPMNKVLDDMVVDRMISQKTIAVPTLTMMEGVSTS